MKKARFLPLFLAAVLLCACKGAGPPPSSGSVPSGGVSSGVSSAGMSSSSAAGASSSIPAASSSVPAVPVAQPFMEEFIRRLPDIYNAEGTSLQNSKEGRDELLAITRQKFADFVDAGILPSAFVDEILPYLARESVNYTRNTDGANYDVLGCNFGMGVNPPFYVTHYYAVETGQAYYTDMSLPFIYELHNADFEAAAENLVAYLGLDVYDDWQLAPEKYLYQGEEREGFLNGSRRFESQTAGLYTHAQWHPDREGQNMVITFGLGIL